MSKATIPVLAERIDVEFNPGDLDFLHGFTYGGGKLWGSAQMSPGRVVVFEDDENLLDNTVVGFPNDGIHTFGLDIVYGAAPGSIGLCEANRANELITYWDANSVPDTDSIGGRLLTNSGVTSIAGKISNGWDFDGLSYLSCPGDSALELVGTDFTIRFWVYVPAPGGVYYALVSNMSVDQTSGWSVMVSWQGADARLEFRIAGGGLVTNIGEANIVPDGQWSHVVISKAGNDYNFYVNGVLTNTSNNLTAILSSAHAFEIGREIEARYADGGLDELLISTFPWTQCEVDADYNGGTGTALPSSPDPSDTPLLYVLHRNVDRSVVGAVNPLSLATTTPINDATVANTNGSLAITPTHLFVATYFGTAGDNGAPDAQILKYDLSDYSKTSVTLIGLKQCHCIRYDGEYLYATGITNGSSRTWLAKIDPVDLTYISVLLPVGIGDPTDDLAFTAEHIWIGTESPSGLKLGHMLVMAKSDLSVVANITPVVPSDFYGVFWDGTHVWGLCTKTGARGKMIRFDTTTYEQRLYSFNDDEGEPNEMIPLSGYLFITLYKAGVQVTRLKIPST